jgi:signal transduction histidine kinase
MAAETQASVWPIVRSAFSSAPAPLRAQVKWVALLWAMMLGLQIWDSSDGRGAAGVAEFLSAILGASGAALLGLAHALQQAMAAAADAPRKRGEAAAVQQVLLALPALGFAAGAVLGAAAVLMVIRALLGAELVLAVVGATVYGLLLVWAGLTVMRSVRTLFRHAEAQAAAAARARGDAAEAHLAALQSRMNPHFLFNALNTIGYLMRAAPERAFGTLLDLTRLLRAVLKRSGGDFATLGQELELVRAYLAIEGARFEDRLRVVVDVPEPLRAWLVPPLVLQPLVENAIKHGITLRAEGGEVAIVARRLEADETLMLQVVDTGMGASEGAMAAGRRQGLGLSSIERRLVAYYGARASLEIASQPGLGTRVTLRIPGGATSIRVARAPEEPRASRPLERTRASA